MLNFLKKFQRRHSNWTTLDSYPGRETSSGYKVTESSMLGIPAVYACIRVLAESIASLPLIVYERFDNGDKKELEDGDIVAIEPFPTIGEGVVIEGKNSEVYEAQKEGNIRAYRDVLDYAAKEFRTLPFCKRYLIKKFGALKASLAVKQMLGNELIKEFKILREKSKGKVAQAEHTLIIGKTNKILT